jgi:alcohol dehydrogenase class IV
MLVTGKGGLTRHADLLKSLGSGDIVSYCVSGEPTVEDAESAVDIAKRNGCDGVLSIGGGSAIDLGKVVAALATNLNTTYSSQTTPTTVYTYMEVVGEGKAIEKKPLPHIAVPTTSGTGAEATKNAVLKSMKHGRKASIRHDWMLPNIAIIDPMLTTTCPPDVTGISQLLNNAIPYY